MPKILELEQHVADLIAAGEVVRRPASVVKELIENSIDAGASIITVEISSGGMSFIRVTDNGCGIDPLDAKTAFLRHATSKLHNAQGLEAINTLGFRGEALAAISAVARIELLTRETGADEGISLKLEAGEVVFTSPVGCPEGTTIIVRDLFFNTPARQKFMKTDRAEGSAVSTVVLRAGLSRPDISFRFIKDGVSEYHTPGDTRTDSCVYSLLGRDIEAGFLNAESSDETVSVTGYISAPTALRGNRSYQFFFVNGRAIRSLLLQSALEQAYKNIIAPGRFPSCVLYISTKPSDVDVNVHPEKAEIKFVSDKQVFDGVYYAALGALERYSEGDLTSKFSSTSELPFRSNDSSLLSDSNRSSGSNGSSFVRDAGHSYNSNRSHTDSMQPSASHAFDLINPTAQSADKTQSQSLPTQYSPDNTTPSAQTERTDRTDYSNPINHTDRTATASPTVSPMPTTHTPDTAPYNTGFALPNEMPLAALTSPHAHFRVVGEALNVYIVVEYNDSVWFIDKHATHERIHFDALKSDEYEPMSEALLTPVICRPGHEEVSVLLDHAELLDNMGFSVERFGEDSLAVRHIPSEIDIGDVESVLSEICVELMHGGSNATLSHATPDNIIKMIACKAAIKAGSTSDMSELELLAEKVFSGEISHCPHGRPIAFEVTKKMLDKGLGRI